MGRRRTQLQNLKDLDNEARKRMLFTPMPHLVFKALLEEVMDGEVHDLVEAAMGERAGEVIARMVEEHHRLFYNIQYWLGPDMAVERNLEAVRGVVEDLMRRALPHVIEVPVVVMMPQKDEEGGKDRSNHMYL